MDARKAFGVEQALGKALAAVPDAVDRLRACATRAEAAAWLATVETRVPRALVEEYLEAVPDAEWPKARAKVLLATRVARGELAAGKGHAAGKGVRKG